MRKAILCLEPEEPVSHMVTAIVIQLELPLNREGGGGVGGREGDDCTVGRRPKR